MKNSKRSRASQENDDQGKYFEDGQASLIEDDRPPQYNGNGYKPDEDTYYRSPNEYIPAHNFQKNKPHQES